MAKTFSVGLQNSTQTSYSNNGKTTLVGRTFQKTINTQSVLGPALTQFIDVETLAGFVPSMTFYNPTTGHLFVLGPASSTPTIGLFTFNNATGAYAYVGKILVSLANAAATTETYRGFKVYENGSSINVLIATTGSVAVNGGVFVAWNCSLAQFTIGGTTIFAASGSNQNAVYFMQDPVAMGVGNLSNTPWGLALPYTSPGYIFTVTSANATVGATYTNNGQTFTVGTTLVAGTSLYMSNSTGAPATSGTLTKATGTGDSTITFSVQSALASKVYSMNGTLAASQVYSWDLSLTPTVAGTATSGVNAQTTLYANTTPSAFFTMAAQNGYSGTNGDQVVLQNGSGNIPTAFNAWTSGTAQVAASNVYFMRDFQQLFTFTCTALTTGISAGSTYTNNGFTFTVLTAASALATTFTASVVPPGAPTSSGTLTRTAGTGDTTITFSAASAGAYYFNLGTTSGGAAITPTSNTTNFTMMRAFGINGSLLNFKTGTLGTTFALGTILQNNSLGYARPVSAPANTALNGTDCLYFLTTAGLYMGKLADLSSLGTTWASMTFTGINISGTGTDIVAPVVANGTYSGQNNSFDIDRFIYLSGSTTGQAYIAKPYQASNITNVFGGPIDLYYETMNPITVNPGPVTASDVSAYGGWLFVSSTTTGQRGIIFLDVYSGATYGNTGIISQVLNVQPGTTFKYINNLAAIYSQTNDVLFWIRSATTSTDTSFNSGTLPVGVTTASGVVSNGWTSIQKATDLSAIAIGPYFQFAITCPLLSGGQNTPGQIIDAEYTCLPPGESSDFWATDVDATTQGLGSPSYAAWYQQLAYSSVVPTLFARVYDTSGNLIFNANTSANPTAFQYSINNGTSWVNLGTIPNTVGTLVRVLVTPTPSVIGFASIRES